MLTENLTTNTTWLVLVVIFIVLLIVIAKALQHTAIFPNRIAVVLAICVSLLSVLGMVHQFGSTDPDADVIEKADKVVPHSVNVILIPYAAMALSILMALFLGVLFWLAKTKTNNRLHPNTTNKIIHPIDDLQERRSKPTNPSITPSPKEERFHDELRKHQ